MSNIQTYYLYIVETTHPFCFWPKKASSQLGGWLNYDLKQKNYKWHYCSFNVSQFHDALSKEGLLTLM
jgi:hypothetical protein